MINGATLNQLFLTAKMKVAPTLKSFRETYVGNHNFPKSVFFCGSHKANHISRNIGLGLLFPEKYEKPHLIDWIPGILLNSNG